MGRGHPPGGWWQREARPPTPGKGSSFTQRCSRPWGDFGGLAFRCGAAPREGLCSPSGVQD